MSPTRDTATFGGAAPLRGRVRLPGDKSLSHRALLFAALARGRSRLRNLATGEDVRATRHALGLLGVHARAIPDDNGAGDVVAVSGAGFDGLQEPDDVVDCHNAGTAMRVLAGLLAGRPFLSVLTGDGSLRQRPMARVVTPLRQMGAQIDGRNDGASAPLVIRGGGLHGIDYDLPMASAQVNSALVLAALQAMGGSAIVEPAPSRAHTERMLAALGAPVSVVGRAVHVQGDGADWSGFDIDVPGDPSSAAFFAVAAAITPGSAIVIEGVSVNPTRTGFVDVLRRMGADVDVVVTGEVLGEPVGDIRATHSPLVATTMSGDEIPNVQDEIPVLAMAAAFAEGVTEVRDAEELATKESNRIGAIQQELMQLGINVEARRDGLVIRGGVPRGGATLKSHGDHRIAMAAAVAAHALPDATTVRGWRAVAVSYPEFEDHFGALTEAP
jgi:3-phosphoshikimate 1-carboxyvinyltransferase